MEAESHASTVCSTTPASPAATGTALPRVHSGLSTPEPPARTQAQSYPPHTITTTTATHTTFKVFALNFRLCLRGARPLDA